MPNIIEVIHALRSPRLSLVVFVFCASLLFAPFEEIGMTRPDFTNDYEIYIITALLLSTSFLLVEALSAARQAVMRLFRIRQRKKWVEETFYQLNVEELCVLWSMTQSGTRTIKGSSSNALMLSLRQKKCLHYISGFQHMNQLHHEMPRDIYEIVRERGYDRMPDDFKNSVRFHDEVEKILVHATDPWS